MGDTAAENHAPDVHSALGKLFHNLPVAKCNRIQQRAIDILRSCFHRQSKKKTGQISVDQSGTIPVEPVQRNQSTFAGFLQGRPAFQQLMQVLSRLCSSVFVCSGQRALNEPIQHIAHTGLSGGVAGKAGHQTVGERAGYAGNRNPFGGDQMTAGGRANDKDIIAFVRRAGA